MFQTIRCHLFLGMLLVFAGSAHADFDRPRPPWILPPIQIDPVKVCIIACDIAESRCVDNAMKYSILACPIPIAGGLCPDPVVSAIIIAMVAKCEDDGEACRAKCRPPPGGGGGP